MTPVTDGPDAGATGGPQTRSPCDLPASEPPVTDDDVAGAYCCRGCLAVARDLADAAGRES